MAGDGTYPDRKLVQKVISGDRAAFGRLARSEIGRLIKLAQRLLNSTSEAEDAVQDALASVWLARRRLDPARPIGPFLTTTTLNKCRDRLRRRKLTGFWGQHTPLDELNLPDNGPDPETSAIDRDALRSLQREIERLPVRLREALVLVVIDGRSHDEAAHLLGVSEKAVETRIYRARKRLREKPRFFEGRASQLRIPRHEP